MSRFNVPTKEEVSPNNQTIFDQLQNSLGFVPNLYAYYAKNETALAELSGSSKQKIHFKNKRTRGDQLSGKSIQRLPLLSVSPYSDRKNERLQR